MTTPRSVLLLADPRPPKRVLADAVERLHRAGARVLLVTYQPLPARYADLTMDDVHALGPAVQAHGPAFRRALRQADPPERLWLHVRHDDWVSDQLPDLMVVVALNEGSVFAARRLARRGPGVQAATGINKAIRFLGQHDGPPPAAGRSRSFGLGDVVDRLPVGVVTALLGTPLLSQSRRQAVARRTVRRLLASGDSTAAADVVLASLRSGTAPRVRADLLGDVVSWSLAHGEQPALVQAAYSAELAVADRAYAAQRYRAAGESFAEAARTAFHRVLHFDHQTSPLAADPAGFTAPLAQSTTAEAVRAPRGRDRTLVNDSTGSRDPIASTSGTTPSTRPTRLLIATRKNADFLGDIREHFAAAPDVDTRFVDFASTSDDLERFVKDPALIVEQVLAGRQRLTAAAEACFRPHLEWADVIFVEWCTALAAVLTQVDPRETRVVVRMHSYEAFTVWPHLMDFSRVDDMVFVSNHLRDLAVAAIPGLRGRDAPRLHVITNAMDLRRFDRPKPDAARFTLGLVGASKMVKDPRWAIEVLRHLRRHDERYRLLLIRGRLQDPSAATRSYVEALGQDLAELEPSGAVQVLAHTCDVPGVLEDVGVVLSTSVRESFHMGLVEGAASGAVPVVRDWPFFPGAARDLFLSDWVVDTPEDAAIRILAATSTDEAWRATGRSAAEHVIGRWDWQVVKHDFDRLLAPVSAGGQSPEPSGTSEA